MAADADQFFALLAPFRPRVLFLDSVPLRPRSPPDALLDAAAAIGSSVTVSACAVPRATLPLAVWYTKWATLVRRIAEAHDARVLATIDFVCGSSCFVFHPFPFPRVFLLNCIGLAFAHILNSACFSLNTRCYSVSVYLG